MADEAIDYIEEGLTILGSVSTDETIRPKVEQTVADIMRAGNGHSSRHQVLDGIRRQTEKRDEHSDKDPFGQRHPHEPHDRFWRRLRKPNPFD